MQNFFKKHGYRIVFAGILLLAAFFRFYGLNWDQNQHLHPDERFLTMVTQAIQWPATFTDYFSTNTSPLNPHNQNFGFFVYGTFPLFLTKVLAEIFKMTDYFNLTLLGRAISAFLDTTSIIFIFLIGKKVFSSKVGILAAFFYAISVLPIQLSHFYAMDTFVNSFIVITTFCLVNCLCSKNYLWRFLAGISFGLSLASKISALAFLSFIIISFFFEFMKSKSSIKCFFIFAFSTFFVFRIAQPYAFSANTFFDLYLNPKFIANLQELSNLSQPSGYFPPGVQWNNTAPILYPLRHMVFWGYGLPLGIVSVISIFFAITTALKIPRNFAKGKDLKTESIILISMTLSTIIMFVYQGLQFAKPIRYFIVVYPFLSILTAYFLVAIFNLLSKMISQKLLLFISWFLLASFLIWPIAFFSIYTRPHSRVQASTWIYENIPSGSKLGVEHWDDALPLSLDAKRNSNLYQFEELPMFNEDSDQKWNILNEKFQKIDYIILSSNRVYGSVVRLPQRYSKTIRYYQDLFSGRLHFTKVAEFTSRPTIFGFEINDDDADETFTVYDHPKIMIFEKQ